MKVLLAICACYQDKSILPTVSDGYRPPVDMALIAAVLRELGHEVNILDCRILNIPKKDIKKAISKFDPEVVITLVTSKFGGSGIRNAFEIVNATKAISQNIITIVYGDYIFILSKEIMSNKNIDFSINGDPEIVIPELLKALDKNLKIKNIKGLIYRKKERVLINKPNYIKDLNSLPFPARDLLKNEAYFSFMSDHPFTMTRVSRGCNFNCGFCYCNKTPLRFRSAKNVVNEIEDCLMRWKFKEIHFLDSTFTLNSNLARSICNEILERGLDFKWEAQTRVDCISLNLLKLMKSAGCYRLKLGIESGNQKILNIMKKGITLNQARKAVKLVKGVGMEAFCYFIIGYPGENERSIRDTIKFAIELNPDFVAFSYPTPFPKTDLFKIAYKKNLLSDKDYWKKFVSDEIGTLPYNFPGGIEWIKKAYRKFYFRSNYIFNIKINNPNKFKKYLFGLTNFIKFYNRLAVSV
jgi:radical SAM superfamily enzyme YgiQ (UPF0313 family)